MSGKTIIAIRGGVKGLKGRGRGAVIGIVLTLCLGGSEWCMGGRVNFMDKAGSEGGEALIPEQSISSSTFNWGSLFTVDCQELDQSIHINFRIKDDDRLLASIKELGVLSGGGEKMFIPWERLSYTELPVPYHPPFSRGIVQFLRVPSRGEVEVSWQVADEVVINDQGEIMKGSGALEEGEGLIPARPVEVKGPWVVRGVRVMQVTFYPLRYDSLSHIYRFAQSLDLSIEVSSQPGPNEVIKPVRRHSSDFQKVLEAFLVNPPPRVQQELDLPGGYLVVANEGYPEAVDEFIEWKRRAGYNVELLTFNPAEVTRADLKEMIREVYWGALEEGREPFEYLLFMGSDDARPPLYIPFVENGQFDQHEIYDNFFALLEGDDILPDAAVGSFNCTTVDNLTCAIRRAISYQYTPYIDDPSWFTRGGVGVGHCSVPEDLSPSYTGKWIAEVMRRNGFQELTESYYSDNQNNDISPLIADLYNAGANLIFVRAHQQDFDPDDIQNRSAFPFHFLVSSSTIAPGGGGAFNRAFRLGGADDIRGPSAGFGHYPSPRTNCANALVGTLAEAIFLKNIRSFGWARWLMCALLPRLMPEDQGQIINRYWGTLRYYGDPGQRAWVGAPHQLQIDYPSEISLQTHHIRISVRDEEDNPVSGARVTLFFSHRRQLTKLTDERGVVDFVIDPGFREEGRIGMMILKDDHIPYRREIRWLEDEEGVAFAGIRFREHQGNHDGRYSPGERFTVVAIITNFGEREVREPHLRISGQSLAPWIEWRGDWEAPEPVIISPGDSIAIEVGAITIGTGGEAGERGGLLLELSGDDITPKTHLEYLPLALSRLEVTSVIFEGDLLPGGVSEVKGIIENSEDFPVRLLTMHLQSSHPAVQIQNNIVRVDTLPPRGRSDTLTLGVIRISPETFRGMTIPLQLTAWDSLGLWVRIFFDMSLEPPRTIDPTGPDHYGYIAIESTDSLHPLVRPPRYEWINCSPWGGDVRGELLPFPASGEIDSSVLVELPFTFRYYGQEFRTITVCNNGWIAVGNQVTLKNQQNWPLPGINGAFGMIAPFWDRLEMMTRSDGVFKYYDRENGRFIIQWQTGTRNINNTWMPNAFQVIIYDPREWNTPTGDSPILFQYHTVNNVQDRWEANAYATVGIASPRGDDGLTFTYWNQYPPSAGRIQSQKAILWAPVRWGGLGAIQGRVFRWIDTTAVAHAEVRLRGRATTFTDEDGFFRFSYLPRGHYHLEVLHPYYETWTSDSLADSLFLEEGDTLYFEVVLNHPWLVYHPEVVRFTWSEGEILPDTLTLIGLGRGEMWIEFELSYPDTSLGPDDFTISFSHNDFSLHAGDTVDISLVPLIGGRLEEGGDFQFELLIKTYGAPGTISVPVQVSLPQEAIANPSLPASGFLLKGVYPNPFNSMTTVAVEAPSAGKLKWALYDLHGRLMEKSEEFFTQKGTKRLVLKEKSWCAGVYCLHLQWEDRSFLTKVVLLR